MNAADEISIPSGAIKSKSPNSFIVIETSFQFLLVRLRDGYIYDESEIKSLISIPSGAIKR